MTLLRDYTRLLLWTTPLCCLFTLLNPALIIYQQDFYPLPLAFWGRLAGAGFAASLVFSLALFMLQWFCRRFWPGKGENIFPTLLGAAFLILFCVTVFFPQSNPLEDGSTVAEPTFREMLPLYIAYGIGWLVLFFFALRRRLVFRRVYIMAIVFGLGVTLYVAGATLWQHSGITLLRADTDISFGGEENIIVIMADALQGSLVEQALTRSPELKDTLPGFTVYTRAVSPFPFTGFAFPAILSGKTYAVETLPTTYYNNMRAARADSFMTDACKVGYDPVALGINSTNFDDKQIMYHQYYRYTMKIIFNNISVGSKRIFRKNIFFDPFTIINDSVLFKQTGVELLLRFAHEKIGRHDKRIFLLHILTPHFPVSGYTLENDRVILSAANPLSAKDVLDEVSFFINLLGRLVEHLQELDQFDRSTIIVVGDHGHYSGGARHIAGLPGGEGFSGAEMGFWGRTASMYNPALMLKKPLAIRHSARISHEPISNQDTRKIIQNILQKKDALENVISVDKGFDIALFAPKTNLNPHLTSDVHILRTLYGNANDLPALMSDPEQAVVEYTLLPWKKKIPAYKLNGYGSWALVPEGVWMTGEKVMLALDLSAAPLDECILDLTISPLINDQHPEQRLLINVSGVDLPQITVTERGSDVSLKISISQDMVRKNHGKALITFTPLDAVTPKSINAWDTDHEQLSFFVRDITLKPSSQER